MWSCICWGRSSIKVAPTLEEEITDMVHLVNKILSKRLHEHARQNSMFQIQNSTIQADDCFEHIKHTKNVNYKEVTGLIDTPDTSPILKSVSQIYKLRRHSFPQPKQTDTYKFAHPEQASNQYNSSLSSLPGEVLYT